MVVSIGPRLNWLGLCTAFLLLLILCGAGIAPAVEGLSQSLREGRSPFGYVLGIVALAVIALFVLYNISLMLFGSETTVIDSSDLEIQNRLLGRVRSRRKFPNSTVENLRYEKWWSGARGTPMEHGIRFECVGETITFARNATEAESREVLDRMRQLYKFQTVEPPEGDSSPAVTHW
jgi:hypothetical protein